MAGINSGFYAAPTDRIPKHTLIPEPLKPVYLVTFKSSAGSPAQDPFESFDSVEATAIYLNDPDARSYLALWPNLKLERFDSATINAIANTQIATEQLSEILLPNGDYEYVKN